MQNALEVPSAHEDSCPIIAPSSPLDGWLLQGVSSRDIKLENTLLDGSPRPLIKVHTSCLRFSSEALCLLVCIQGNHVFSV
jgi:hypothetical protein